MERGLKGFIRRISATLLAAAILIAALYVEIPAAAVEAAGTKLVAFTFDDGPSGNTGRLLDGLKARGAKATFFMNGVNGSHGVRNHMDLVRRMVSEGHEIANHTWSHVTPFTKLSGAQMQSQVSDVNSYLYDAMGGSFQSLVRIPGGARSQTITSNVSAPMILWSVDTLDWKYRNSTTVYNNIMKSVSDGGIVLLHDLYNTSIDGALRAISDLQNQGYECVTVSELFRRRGLTLQNGKTYTKAGVTGVNLPAYSDPVIQTSRDSYGYTSVSIKEESGLTYYYTTDGTDPKYKGNEMPKSLKLTVNTQLKVVGYDKFGTRTPVASQAITVEDYFGTFDAVFYANKYEDLKKAFGYDEKALWNHYVTYGLKEGRQGSAVFSINEYKAKYGDLRKAFGDNNMAYLSHFAKYGINEKRQGSSSFDVNSYRRAYADLRRAYGSDTKRYYAHYMKYGYNEKRKATGTTELQNPMTVYNGIDYSKVYDYYYYVNKYPDIKRAFGEDDAAVLKHFVTYGMKEGRQAKASFELSFYKNRYADLRKAYGANNSRYYLHYINYGYKEHRKAAPESN